LASSIGLLVLLFWLAGVCSPLPADVSSPPPSATDADNFSQYLADHQAELAPFFTKNASELFRQAVPVLLGMMGWVVISTMIVGWGVDVLMSRGYAFLFAPVFAEWKRSVLYATGRLCLSFLYTCLMVLTILLGVSLAHAGAIIVSVLVLLFLVAFAAPISCSR
jgi:hypothetical protein